MKRKLNTVLIASSILALRVMQPLAVELLRRGIKPTIIPLGSDADDINKQSDFSLASFISHPSDIGVKMHNASAVIVTDVIKSLPPTMKKFGITHGSMPSAYRGAVASSVDIYFCQSSDDLEFIHRNKKTAGLTDCIVAGSPAMDVIFRAKNKPISNSLLGYLSSKGFDADRKTILLTSHWSSLGLFHLYGERILDFLRMIAPKANLIVSGHPKLFDRSPKFPGFDINVVRGIISQTENLGGIFWSKNTPDLLPLADVVVGDLSSIMAQAAIFDADIICDRRNHTSARVTEELFKNMSYTFGDLESLKTNLLYALENPNQRKAQKADFVRHSFPNIGKSCSVIASHIEDVIFEKQLGGLHE